MTYSIIQKSQLEGALRLDAEYFQPDFLEYEKEVSKFNLNKLNAMCSIITQGPNPIFQNSGIPCVNGRNVRNCRLELNNPNFISHEEFKKLKRFRIRQGDILITLKGLGSIGKLGYVNNDTMAIFSRDIGLIRTKDINTSKFIFAFLLSKHGYSQIEKSISGGTGQLTLTTSSIKEINVPKLKSNSIKEIVTAIEKSEQLFSNSNLFFKQAEDSLLEELCLKDFKKKNELFSVVNLSEVQSANRIDAEYFQPKFAQLINKLTEIKSEPLSNVLESVPAKFNPLSQPEKEFTYIELSNIDLSSGTINGSSQVLGKEAASRAKRILRKNDVVVSSVEGSLEKVALVSSEQEGYLASTGFFQFRSKKILPEVLSILAKSIVFQYQLKQRCAGTILTAVPQDSIKDILIPILPKTTQERITDLVRKSHEARKKSKELLEGAKRKVEELIDKGKS